MGQGNWDFVHLNSGSFSYRGCSAVRRALLDLDRRRLGDELMTPEQITAALTGLAAVISALAVLIGALKVNKKLDVVHKEVNSRLTELLTSNKLQAHAEGFTAGEQANRTRHEANHGKSSS